ncbi:MAG: hypothetical protein AB8B53_11975 [Flavobacteriales bacterium]
MSASTFKTYEAAFSFLEEHGFKKTVAKKGKEHLLTYKNEDAECLVSWNVSAEKPSLTYEDEMHLFGILDCEKEIRAKHKDLPEKQQEFLAWVFSAMPLNQFLEVFTHKVKKALNV